MSEIVLKTRKRKTSVTRAAVKNAVNKVYKSVSLPAKKRPAA